MKQSLGIAATVAAFLCAAGVFAFILVTELSSLKSGISTLAGDRLLAGLSHAKSAIGKSLSEGDFRAIGDFGLECAKEGARFAVFSRDGGVVYDSGNAREEPFPDTGGQSIVRYRDEAGKERILASGEFGDYRLVLSHPLDAVEHLVHAARKGHFTSAGAAALGIALILVAGHRAGSGIARLRREKEAQALLLDEMKRIEQFRSGFISDMAHEIRTPLSGIVASAELLAADGADDGERKTLAKMIREESLRLNSLAEEILTLSRLENAPAMKNGFRSVSLRELLCDIAARFAPAAEAAGVSVEIAPGEDVALDCDANLVERAVSNLLSNSIKHASCHTIVLEASREGGIAKICVKDDGIGIPEEERERIFERFYRIDKARSTAPGSFGLGLAIASQVAKLHDGSLKCLPSERGAHFELALPVCRKGENHATKKQ